jgi:hypothetical protein
MLATAATVEVLECVVGQATVGIPRASVAQLIEYELVPLPAPGRYIGGLGVHAGSIVISVALTPLLGNARRPTRGVLLEGGDGTDLWVIEVSRVGAFTRATLAGATSDTSAPRWLARAATPFNRNLIAIDVPAMVRDLSSVSG